MTVYRAVFDTSTLVSAALRLDSVPHQALLGALSCCDLCTSEATLRELRGVLTRPKFRSYASAAARQGFLRLIERHARRYVVQDEDLRSLAPACRDRKGNQFLALAAEAEAQVVVSSDEDRLVLDPWNGVRVVRPAEFLVLLLG
jgi:putative PIN family toxin of toxin-antitoxin system